MLKTKKNYIVLAGVIIAMFFAIIGGTLLFCGGISTNSLVVFADANGTCGDNLTWSYNSTTKTLSIHGFGNMTDFNTTNNVPGWYSYKEDIEAIEIGKGMNDNVTSIGALAFSSGISITGFSSLNSVTIAGTVSRIGAFAFGGCGALESIVLPSSIDEIEHHAFENCTNLSEINLPNGIEYIGDGLFERCTSLKTIEIPVSVTTICSNAFADSGLESIEIPDSVERFNGTGQFNNCSDLETVTLGDGLREIPFFCFYGCENLTTLHLGTNIRKIGFGAFGIPEGDYQNLEQLNIFIDATYQDFVSGLAEPKSIGEAVANFAFNSGWDENDESYSTIFGWINSLADALNNYEADNQNKLNAVKTPIANFYNYWDYENVDELSEADAQYLGNFCLQLNSSTADNRLSIVCDFLDFWWEGEYTIADALSLINDIFPSAENEIKILFANLAWAIADYNTILFNEDEEEEEGADLEFVISEGYQYNSVADYEENWDWTEAFIRPAVIHFNESLTPYYSDMIDGLDSENISYVIEGTSPETGVVLDIIIPSTIIGLVALATIAVWKKKEQF